MFNQLEFLTETEEEKYRKELMELHKKYENLRKSFYANDNKRKKENDDLRHKIDTLIVAMCRNQEYKNCIIF